MTHITGLYFKSPAPIAEDIFAYLDTIDITYSWQEIPQTTDWDVSIFLQEGDDLKAIQSSIEALFAGHQSQQPTFTIEDASAIDWLQKNKQDFPPVLVGPFAILNNHHDRDSFQNLKVIALDAATAFGSGHHETTRGCLLALDALSGHSTITKIIDVGCGSGILAMAAAHLFPHTIIACDIDPESVRVTKENAEHNNLAHRINVYESDGVAATQVKDHGPYDLVIANILAGPLCTLAPDIRGVCSPQAYVILSGLLDTQAPQVKSVYEKEGYTLVNHLQLSGWSTLTLKRGS